MNTRKSQCNNNNIDETKTTTKKYLFRHSLERDIAKVSGKCGLVFLKLTDSWRVKERVH